MMKSQKRISSASGRNVPRIPHHADEPTPFESNATSFRSRRFWNSICDCAVG
jgi:hypothetical protein